MPILETDNYVVRYNDNRIECIPKSGAPDVDAELKSMQKEATNEWLKKPIETRAEFAYDYLVKKFVNLQRKNGVACPNVSEAESFAQLIMNRVFQQQKEAQDKGLAPGSIVGV